MSTATYCHVSATVENSAVCGGLGAIAPLGAARPPQTPPARTATATTATELPLKPHHRRGGRQSPETIERIRVARLEQEEARRRASRAVEQAEARAERRHSSHTAVRLYRREKKRHDKGVAKLIEEAKLEMARLDELHRLAHKGGRPKKVRNG